MSVMTQTAVGHVTSTTTSGKYLNPETIDISEIYSKRTPLDLLIETCNNIGRETGPQQTGAKQRRPRTSLRDQSDHWHQSRSTGQQGTRLSDADDVAKDWYPTFQDNKGTRSFETLRRVQPTEGESEDQEGPEDLRLWCNRQSPGGSSMLSSPGCSGRRTPSGDSLSSLSPPSHPSPTVPDGASYPGFSHDPMEEKRPMEKSPLREREAFSTSPPQGLDPGFLLHQFLELQSMVQLAMLQERANQVRRLTLEKPLTAFTSPAVAATELLQEPRAIHGLSDIPACHQLLSHLQQEEIFRGLSSGVALDGLLPPGLSYLGETSPIRGPLVLPPFYHQQFASKAGFLGDGFLPGIYQMRPEDMVLGMNPLFFAKHLELLGHLSDSPLSRSHPHYEASPIQRGYSPDSSDRLSPKKPEAAHSPSRKLESRSPGARDVQRRHHPYGWSGSVASKSSKSLSRHSAFREPVLLSEKL